MILLPKVIEHLMHRLQNVNNFCKCDKEGYVTNDEQNYPPYQSLIFLFLRTVKDSTSAVGLIILLFVLPARLDFLHAFDKDPTKRPTKPSPGLIGWKIINQKMHWSLIFVLGGGFAIAAGSQSSGLSSMLGRGLIGLKTMDPFWILFIVCVFAETATELTSNVAVANIILPVLAEMVSDGDLSGWLRFFSVIGSWGI